MSSILDTHLSDAWGCIVNSKLDTLHDKKNNFHSLKFQGNYIYIYIYCSVICFEVCSQSRIYWHKFEFLFLDFFPFVTHFLLVCGSLTCFCCIITKASETDTISHTAVPSINSCCSWLKVRCGSYIPLLMSSS